MIRQASGRRVPEPVAPGLAGRIPDRQNSRPNVPARRPDGHPLKESALPVTHLALLLFICLVWAGNFIAAAWAVSHMPPVAFTVLRFALVLAIVWPFLARPAKGHWPLLLAACWCMGALHFSLVFLALSRSGDVSSVAILMQIYIPMATILAVVLLREQVGWRTAVGVGISFAGVLVVGFDPLALAQLDAIVLVLASAFFLALGTIAMRRLRGVGMFNFQAWNALLSLAPLALLSWLLEGMRPAELAGLDWTVWAAVVYSAVVSSIVGHGGFYWLVQRNPVTHLMPWLLLVPVLAVLFGVLVWGDRPGWRLLAGGLMVLGGVLWVTLRARQRERRVAEEPAAV